MRIIESARFSEQRDSIVYYIAQDNRKAALDFAKNLKTNVNLLVNFPHQCQQSKYFDDTQIRDMVFKGYTVIYRVQPNAIEVLQVFNQNLPEKLCN